MPTQNPSVTILGPGGVGGLLAALLARAGEKVTVVAGEQTAALIGKLGISVQSVRYGDFTSRPDAVTELRVPGGLLLVATKSTTLAEALRRIKAQPLLVVPLLNGLDHMTILRDRFGAARVAAGSIRVEAHRPQPGRVVHSSPMLRVDLASDDPALRPALARLGDVLERAQIPVEIGQSEAQVLWSKLARLAPLALTTSVADRPVGFIRSDPHWRDVLEAAIAEVAAVANADGAQIDPAAPLAELDAAHPTLSSSMQRDLSAGRPPELAIPRAVVAAAKRHGLECPTVVGLMEQVERRGDRPRGALAARRPSVH